MRGVDISLVWVVDFYETSERVLTNRVQSVDLSFEAIAKPPKQLNELIKEATVGAGRMFGCCTTWPHCFLWQCHVTPLAG